MNHTLTNPIGLDSVVKTIQTKLYTLATVWGVDLDGYPRCYPSIRDNKKVIEHFVSGGEYEEMVYAEGNKFFFVCENDLDLVQKGWYETTISVFFMLNLAQVKPSIAHRATSEVYADVSNVLKTIPIIDATSGKIATNFDRVFQGFDYEFTDDLQPYHYFRIDIPTQAFELTKTYCS